MFVFQKEWNTSHQPKTSATSCPSKPGGVINTEEAGSALTAVAPADAFFALLSLMVLVVRGVAVAWFTCVVFLPTRKMNPDLI